MGEMGQAIDSDSRDDTLKTGNDERCCDPPPDRHFSKLESG